MSPVEKSTSAGSTSVWLDQIRIDTAEIRGSPTDDGQASRAPLLPHQAVGCGASPPAALRVGSKCSQVDSVRGRRHQRHCIPPNGISTDCWKESRAGTAHRMHQWLMTG